MHPVDVKAKIGKSVQLHGKSSTQSAEIDRKQVENDELTRHHEVFTNCIRNDIVKASCRFYVVIGAVVAHVSGWKHKISAKFKILPGILRRHLEYTPPLSMIFAVLHCRLAFSMWPSLAS
jgi:hypothetical protein